MPSLKYKKRTYAGASFPVLAMTKAEYNALPVSKKYDGTVYLITDDDGGWEAERSVYDNAESGLTATNVQDALDEIANDLNGVAPLIHTHAWGEITDKPSTFTPSSHTHTWGNITGKPSTKWTLLGGFASTSFTSTYKNTTLSASMSGYGLIRMNTSYYAAGLPDYGGITASYEQIKAATNEPLVVCKFDGQYRFHIKYVNDTTLAISVAGTTGANNCLSIHGLL